MYEELASVRETVVLSPGEVLDSAQALLTQHGYSIAQRTDTLLTAERRNKEGELLYISVVTQVQEHGGTRVQVRGNDREGVQARQAEWMQWADSLPKREGPRESDANHESERQTESIVPQGRPEEQSSAAEETIQNATVVAQFDNESPHQMQGFVEKEERGSGMYEYRMIQIPPTISVQASQHKGDEAAKYMESIANSHSEQGWEFYRVDTLSVSVPPGCLAALFGDKGSLNQYYVMTFRQTKP